MAAMYNEGRRGQAITNVPAVAAAFEGVNITRASRTYVSHSLRNNQSFRTAWSCYDSKLLCVSLVGETVPILVAQLSQDRITTTVLPREPEVTSKLMINAALVYAHLIGCSHFTLPFTREGYDRVASCSFEVSELEDKFLLST